MTGQTSAPRRWARTTLATVLLVAALAISGCSQTKGSSAQAPAGQDPYRIQTDHGCPPAGEISDIVGDTVKLTTQDNDPIVCTFEQPATDVFGTVRFAFSSGMTLDDYIARVRKQAPKATFDPVTIDGVRGIEVGGGVALPVAGGVMEVSASGFENSSQSGRELAKLLAGRYAAKIVQDMKG